MRKMDFLSILYHYYHFIVRFPNIMSIFLNFFDYELSINFIMSILLMNYCSRTSTTEKIMKSFVLYINQKVLHSICFFQYFLFHIVLNNIHPINLVTLVSIFHYLLQVNQYHLRVLALVLIFLHNINLHHNFS